MAEILLGVIYWSGIVTGALLAALGLFASIRSSQCSRDEVEE